MINERPHKNLELWKESMNLVEMIYKLTNSFPKEETFGLKSQLRRAAVSVPSNISEGLTRSTKPAKLHFLNIAFGSMSEIDTQIEISLRLQYLDSEKYESVENKIVQVNKLLSGLIRKLRS